MMRKDEKGVSPVIGVILMVAVTVILAAVVWTFVSSSVSTVSKKTPNAALQAVGGQSKITIKHIGGDPINCGELEIKIDGASQDLANLGCSGYFSVGTELTKDNVDAGVHTVTVIYLPTNTVLLETTVRVWS